MNPITLAKQKYHNLISDTKISEIITGSAWALSSHVISASFSMVISIIIARYYGAAAMGIVAVITSYLTLITTFTVMGTNASILRLIPEHLAKYSPTSAFRVYRKAQYFVMGISLITGSLFFFWSGIVSELIFKKPHLSSFFALAAIFIIFRSMMLINTQAIRGLRLIKTFAFMLGLPAFSNLILLVLLTVFLQTEGNPVYSYLVSLLITGVVGWVVMEYSFKRRMQSHDNIRNMSIFSILRISMPMLMSTTMSYLISGIGVIMLGIFRPETEVGYYAIAAKLAILTSYILNAVNSMAAPKFSELFFSDKIDELFYVAKKSAKLIFWTTTPILLGLIVLGKPMLEIGFGFEFGIAYPAMVLLVFGQFVHSISGATALFMNMTGNEKVLRNIMILSAIINIGLNLLLIPLFGIYGTAAAAMVSLSAWNITALIYIKRKFGKTTGYFPRLLWW